MKQGTSHEDAQAAKLHVVSMWLWETKLASMARLLCRRWHRWGQALACDRALSARKESQSAAHVSRFVHHGDSGIATAAGRRSPAHPISAAARLCTPGSPACNGSAGPQLATDAAPETQIASVINLASISHTQPPQRALRRQQWCPIATLEAEERPPGAGGWLCVARRCIRRHWPSRWRGGVQHLHVRLPGERLPELAHAVLMAWCMVTLWKAGACCDAGKALLLDCSTKAVPQAAFKLDAGKTAAAPTDF